MAVTDILLAAGALVLVSLVVFAAWPSRPASLSLPTAPARRPPPASARAPADPSPPSSGSLALTFVRVGDALHVLDGLPEVVVHEDRVVLALPDGSQLVRDPRGDTATLTVEDHTHRLVSELEPATLELDTPKRKVLLVGLEGRYISPPHGQIVRERSIFVGTALRDLAERMVLSFSQFLGDEPDAAIPWTLEGATRYAQRFFAERDGSLEVEREGVGELALQLEDGAQARVSLANVWATMEQQDPTTAKETLERFLISSLPTVEPLEREQLLPRLIRGQPPLRIGSRAPASDDLDVDLDARPIGDDLSVFYVQDLPDRMRYLTAQAAREVEADDAARFALAADNLRATIRQIRIVGSGPLFMILGGGNYEASLVLLPELWAAVDPLLDGPRLMAVPARDLLLVTGDTGEARRQLLRQSIRVDRELAYPISDGIYRWDAARQWWRRLPE